jgi:acyl-CoA thioesterase FadM
MFMDRVRFELSLRSGFWRVMRENGVMPVLASLSIRFRKSILLWQKFEVTARLVTWDERWFYVEHKVFTGGELAAVVIGKSALVSKTGRISAEQFAHIMAQAGPRPPVPDLVPAKEAVDKLLVG